jgi:hypothetical protein
LHQLQYAACNRREQLCRLQQDFSEPWRRQYADGRRYLDSIWHKPIKLQLVGQSVAIFERWSALQLDTDDLEGLQITPTSLAVKDSKGQQFLRHPVYLLRCPSYVGAQTSDVSVSGAQVTTYHALSATRLEFMAMPTRADGLIIPGGGVRERDVTDGLSSTLLLCESKEPRFAVWGEAVTNWVVALDPAQTASNTQLDWAEMRTSLRLGAQKYDTPYLPARLWAAGGDRWWGPSSDHRGGVVIHAFGDAGTRALTPDVDAKVYASIVTRSGADEP